MFNLPLREIEAKYCKSEIFIVAWRSQETVYQMNKKFKDIDKHQKDVSEEVEVEVDGDLDLRKMKSKDVFNYFSSIGLNFPIMETRRK